MLNLGNQLHIDRLYTAINHSREAMRPFRLNRKRMIEEFVGSYYNSNGAKYEVLVNLLAITAETYTIGLAAENPRVRVSTEHRDLWPFAYRYRCNINKMIKEMRFAQTHQQIVLDAFFSIGVSKTFQREWETIQLEDDVWADPGRPYVGRVSPDDFVMDMSVKDIRRCRFMVDEYRVAWESIVNDKSYDPKIVAKLAPSSKWDRGEEQTHDITQGSMVDDDDYEPMVDLMDVWLPELNKIGVFARHRQEKPLKLLDPGPEGGPYDQLIFTDVPDNVMPTSPASNLMGLHLLYNGLLRKQARQAKRQKSNPVFRPTGADDAKRLQRYGDGEWVKTNDPRNVGVVNQGGVDQGNVAFSMNVYDLWDRSAGNISAMAGLGAQADTAKAEELIHRAASRKEAKLINRDEAFQARVMSKVGHLMWADEFLGIESSYEVGRGTGAYVDMSWNVNLREGDFWQYNFEVEPYSSNYESPEAKVGKMERLIAVVERMYPLVAQAGGSIDVQEIVRQYGDLLNFPEADLLVTFATPPNVERPGIQVKSGMPQNTSREYVRRNVPTGGTQQSRNQIMQQVLGNGSANQDQLDSLSLPGAA
tara:strand:+ start:2647 stop:4413 length:1767 start_codon:yes stop_codon:yes gene_type:complete